MPLYLIHTDGACSGNPGPGGYAALISQDGADLALIQGGEPETTNNRMEMRAVLEALRHLPDEAVVEVVSDSQLVIKTMTGEFSRKKNRELWSAIDEQVVRLGEVRWTWVRGHNGDPRNERADEMARAAVAQVRKTGEAFHVVQTLVGMSVAGMSEPRAAEKAPDPRVQALRQLFGDELDCFDDATLIEAFERHYDSIHAALAEAAESVLQNGLTSEPA